MICQNYPTHLNSPDLAERLKVTLALGLPEETANSGAGRKRSCYTKRTQLENLQDFVRRIKPIDSGCWVWLGCITSKWGHGCFKYRGRNVAAHRLSKALSLGVDPSEIGWVCHHCDNGWCINPEHSYLGTPQSNVSDRDRRGRAVHPFGESSGSSKLTEVQVLQIRDMFKARIVTHKMLGERFGISARTARAITDFKIWKHLGLGEQRKARVIGPMG